MFGVIGPDGAGKTTTIRLLCGLLRPDGGTLRVLGHDPVREHQALTRKVGYFSQRFSLYGDLSIDENIAFFAEIHGLKRYDERRNRLLEMTQLTPFRDRLADRLSGGMKQKLALACTLVHEPQVILLDEPTTGVDPVSRREFWKLLSEFLAQGITILMATPYLDEAERCSRVGLFSGRPPPRRGHPRGAAREPPGRAHGDHRVASGPRRSRRWKRCRPSPSCRTSASESTFDGGRPRRMRRRPAPGRPWRLPRASRRSASAQSPRRSRTYSSTGLRRPKRRPQVRREGAGNG